MNKAPLDAPFFKDRPILLLLIGNGLLAFATVASVFVRLRSSDFKVPVQYVVNDGSVLQTSQWFTLYSIALFSVLSAVATVVLAQRLHRGERNYAQVVLIVYAVISVFGLLATNALLGLVSRV